MAESTTPLWALLVIGVLFIALAAFGTVAGLADGEGGVSGAQLLWSALRAW